MPRKKKVVARMIQKVVVNIGGKSSRAPRAPRQPRQQQPQILQLPALPVDAFSARHQLQTQLQSQLKMNQDLITALGTRQEQLKPNIDPQELKPLQLAPAFSALRLDETPHVRLDARFEHTPRTASSSTSGDPYFSTKGPHLPRFGKSSAGSVRVINPRSGREIGYGSKKYHQLVKDGYLTDTRPPSGTPDDNDEKED